MTKHVKKDDERKSGIGKLSWVLLVAPAAYFILLYFFTDPVKAMVERELNSELKHDFS